MHCIKTTVKSVCCCDYVLFICQHVYVTMLEHCRCHFSVAVEEESTAFLGLEYGVMMLETTIMTELSFCNDLLSIVLHFLKLKKKSIHTS